MTRRSRLPRGPLVALLALGPALLAGDFEPDTPAAFDGTWHHVGGSVEEHAIHEAAERCVSELSLLLRPVARRRLLEGTMIAPEIEIDAVENWVSIREGRRELASAIGDTTTVMAPNGQPIELLHEFEDGFLVQHRSSEQGGRHITYRLTADGRRMIAEIVTNSRHLPMPMVYELTYERREPRATRRSPENQPEADRRSD